MDNTKEIKTAGSDSNEDIFKVHHKDARDLLDIVTPNSIDVTITSPPYFDLKDYGNKKQIGFGQDYKTYLSDLKSVFSHVNVATKQNGSLWIIIDSFRRDQELLPLPFDLASELKEVGWSLKDIIIWKKERTLPWSKPGTTRNIFEYILVFSKTGYEHQYFPDHLREIGDLKHWWVKYPERYNPKGKSLEEIWSFDIPTQGSWGNGYVRHFCPLPEDLVQRIISLTTNEGDVVLDPFSGSGTVPAQAAFMGRNYIGFELNVTYIAAFEEYLKKNKKLKSEQYLQIDRQDSIEVFEKTIINLRVLKLGRMLLKEASKNYSKFEPKLLIEHLETEPNKKFKIATARYTFFISSLEGHESLLNALEILSSKAPLSKYGIQIEFKFSEKNLSIKNNQQFYGYTLTNTHKFKVLISSDQEFNLSLPIASPICVDLDENDYK